MHTIIYADNGGGGGGGDDDEMMMMMMMIIMMMTVMVVVVVAMMMMMMMMSFEVICFHLFFKGECVYSAAGAAPASLACAISFSLGSSSFE